MSKIGTNGFVAAPAALDMVILPRIRERLKGFKLRRVLGNVPNLSVGPFVLFDHAGPVVFAAGTGLDAGPHPHVGMATLSYLFDGTLVHRDGMGNAQTLEPGAANWMIAGRGTAHSERTPLDKRDRESPFNFAQLWLALPREDEESEPSFEHHAAAALPVIEDKGVNLRLVAGNFGKVSSPVGVRSPTLCADVQLAAGARFALPPEHEERSAYIVSGTITLGDDGFPAGQMLVFRPGEEAVMTADGPARLLLLGGTRLDGPRYMWSTVVSSRRDRIEQAKSDWESRRIASVAGEAERGAFPVI